MITPSSSSTSSSSSSDTSDSTPLKVNKSIALTANQLTTVRRICDLIAGATAAPTSAPTTATTATAAAPTATAWAGPHSLLVTGPSGAGLTPITTLHMCGVSELTSV